MRSTRHKLMRERRLNRDQRFTYNVLNSTPHVNTVPVSRFNVVENVMEIPFVTFIFFSPTFIVIWVFIDCVVRQMHVNVFKIWLKRWLVWNCGESSKPFFMNKNSKRTDSINKNVDSEVEFEIINQKRLVNVSLNYIPICFSQSISTSN